MNARTRQSMLVFLGLCAFAMLSWAIFIGYLTPDMLLYYLSFRWCF